MVLFPAFTVSPNACGAMSHYIANPHVSIRAYPRNLRFCLCESFGLHPTGPSLANRLPERPEHARVLHAAEVGI